ncbi:MAG: hypothetical protein ACLR8Y_00035 [Alistipes indistinctus]
MKTYLLQMQSFAHTERILPAQVLITTPSLSRRTVRASKPALRGIPPTQRTPIVMSKGYRFVPDQFQQMPAGVAKHHHNPNFMLTVNSRMWTSTCRYPGTPLQVPPSPLNALMPQVQGYAAVQNSDGWTITQTDAMTRIHVYFHADDLFAHAGRRTDRVATDQTP